jgi:RNA polymerase sigma factor (sigma-70 family)
VVRISQAIPLDAAAVSPDHSAGASPIADLTRRMVGAEEAAYAEFFRLFSDRLFRYLLVTTSGKEELATELLQQTMIKVARHVRVFNDETALWRWLTVLARTAGVDESRKSSRLLRFLDRFRLSSRNDSNARLMPTDSFDSIFAEQLDGLPDEDRSLLEKKYVEGFSVSEIAALFTTTEKAIESRLSRVRTKLRTNILKVLENESHSK